MLPLLEEAMETTLDDSDVDEIVVGSACWIEFPTLEELPAVVEDVIVVNDVVVDAEIGVDSVVLLSPKP